MKKTTPAGFTTAQLAAARKSGGTIKLGGPAPAKSATKPAPTTTKPVATTVKVSTPAKTATSGAPTKAKMARIRKKVTTGTSASGRTPAAIPPIIPPPVIPPPIPVSTPSKVSWWKKLIRANTATATAPVRHHNWFGWLFLIIVILAIIIGLMWKKSWLFFSEKPAVQIVRGVLAPQVEVSNALIPLPASTNQTLATVTPTNPPVPVLAVTPTSGVSNNTVPHNQQWPSKVTGIEGDNNDGNTVVNNFGTINYTTDGSKGVMITVKTNLPGEVNVPFRLPPGCTSVREIRVHPSSWNSSDVPPVNVEMKPGEYVRVIPPPTWLMDGPYVADGPIMVTHDGVTWDHRNSARITVKEWGYYMLPGTTACNVVINFKNPKHQ